MRTRQGEVHGSSNQVDADASDQGTGRLHGYEHEGSQAVRYSFSELAVRETKKNGVFVIPGIGRLVRVDRKARMGRNPATGEAIKIPAKKVVKFRVAKAVKDAIVRQEEIVTK